MSTIKQRAKKLSEELQKLYDDACEEGIPFKISFEAAYQDYDGLQDPSEVGFEIEHDYTDEEDDDGNIETTKVFYTSPIGGWYNSNC